LLSTTKKKNLLSVQNLVVSFDSEAGRFRAVDQVSFDVAEQSTVCIVGESGCGKSVTSFSLLQLISFPGFIDAGSVFFEERDLLTLSEKEMQKVRGAKISMIFQEPMTSLNPVYTIGDQIVEAIRCHQSLSRSEAKKKAISLLNQVRVPSPEERYSSYPHELSGGMRQRVMIAMALSCNPKLLIADEPTTALDVTVQAQILDLIRSLQHEHGMSVLLITHDLGIVAECADWVIVMYAGQVVEEGAVTTIFADAKHPYTRGLLQAMPTGFVKNSKKKRLKTIDGVVADLRHLPKGCRFQERCSWAIDICFKEEPSLQSVVTGEQKSKDSKQEHKARCHRMAEITDLYQQGANSDDAE
jgi:oligopeptide/dipeptide ABC transporter ATP-binding protein